MVEVAGSGNPKIFGKTIQNRLGTWGNGPYSMPPHCQKEGSLVGEKRLEAIS